MTQDLIIGNAAGTCKTLSDVQKLARSGLTDITVGSITVNRREGNSGTVHYKDSSGQSINALGLPNRGINTYKEWFPDMLQEAHSGGKRLWASIAPIEGNDIDILVSACIHAGVDGIELNAGCPNVWKGKSQKLPLSFQPEQLYQMLVRLLEKKQKMDSNIGVRLKLSPGDPGRIADIATTLLRIRKDGYPLITLVTANTWPNGFMYDWHDGYETPAEPAIHPFFGGISGYGYKAIALGQVRQLKELLPSFPVIGVGGISNGWDAWEYFHSGAIGIQIGAALFYADKPNLVINQILEEYSTIAIDQKLRQ